MYKFTKPSFLMKNFIFFLIVFMGDLEICFPLNRLFDRLQHLCISCNVTMCK